MKTYKKLMELVAKSWKDIKDRSVKREAGQILKALDKDEVLAYSAEHDEFSVFKNDKDLEKAKKGSGKKMNWLKVERRVVDGELLSEKFNFRGALKTGMLDKHDEPNFKALEKKGWEILEFNLTSKGYELIIKKGGKTIEYNDKTPSKVLHQAAKKAK